MTETPAPYYANPPQAPEDEAPLNLELPDTPRITPGNLEEITIPAGAGTLARYGLKSGERYARLEDLDQDEKNAVLAFLLRYSPPIVARKIHRAQSKPGELPELDPAPLAALLNDNPKESPSHEKE